MKDKIVLVTGASSGIGRACAELFVSKGARLILCARRKERLIEIKSLFSEKYRSEVMTLAIDVRNKEEVLKGINGLPEIWKEISVLVNNAGLARGLGKIFEGDFADWEEMIDTNLKGLLYMTRAVTPFMLKNGLGHIINIGSIAGREVYPNGNVYCATKHAVAALTRGMKMDLHGTPIRVSTVDPGLVETEFSVTRFRGDLERAKKVYEGMTPLTPQDIAQCVYFCATQPLHVNISELVVMPTAQSSATMVSRITG